jgi:hypothetical protein
VRPGPESLAPGTPSEAVRRGLCPMCLGTGETFHIVLGRLAPCSGCGGGRTLDAMTAHQCVDSDCPDHGGAAIEPLNDSPGGAMEEPLIYRGVHRCGAIRVEGERCLRRTAPGQRCVHHGGAT